MLESFVLLQSTDPIKSFDSFLSELFQVLAAHKSIKNIKIQFIVNGTFDFEIFEDIIKLAQAKPNTIFENLISEYDTSDEEFQDYKNKFEETQQLIKINMKMIFT